MNILKRALRNSGLSGHWDAISAGFAGFAIAASVMLLPGICESCLV